MQNARNKNIKILFFDLGDTLIFFNGDYQKVFSEGMVRLTEFLKTHLPGLDEKLFLEIFRQKIQDYYFERDTEFIEHTTYRILKRILEDFGHTEVSQRLLKNALVRLYSVSERHWDIGEDTVSTLKTLREAGYKIGLISNAGDAHNAHRLIDRYRLRKYLDFILISAEVGVRKPAPLIFKMALDHWAAKPQEAVMIGDTLLADILGAKRVGMYTVWITKKADNLLTMDDADAIQPDAVIHTLSELPAILLSLD